MLTVFLLGYRIKLHFDGYPKEYDYWVNADCPDLFYARWCQENSRALQPPKGYENKIFDWTDYLAEKNALPAPKWNFSNSKHSSVSCRKFSFNNNFKILY